MIPSFTLMFTDCRTFGTLNNNKTVKFDPNISSSNIVKYLISQEIFKIENSTECSDREHSLIHGINHSDNNSLVIF